MSSEDVVAALRGRGSAPESGAGHSRRSDYEGRAGEVAGIAATNGLLGLVTLGFYRFWGKTRFRRYLWGRVGFDGDAFEYTGTGKELFLGFLVAIAVLIPLGILFAFIEFAFPTDPTAQVVIGVVKGLSILLLVQFAIYRARRYRLTRSLWRGIRGGQTGSAVKYAFVALGWYVLVGITLGLAYPVMRTALQRYRTENTWFGTERFTFQGRAGALFWRWFLAWLLWIPTMGIIYTWYSTVEFRYFAANTRYSGLIFKSNLHAGRVIWIWLRSVLVLLAFEAATVAIAVLFFPGFVHGFEALIIGEGEAVAVGNIDSAFLVIIFAIMLLFGIVASVVHLALFVHPLLGEICRTLTITGKADFDAILQSQRARPARGEGFADALDVGAI